MRIEIEDCQTVCEGLQKGTETLSLAKTNYLLDKQGKKKRVNAKFLQHITVRPDTYNTKFMHNMNSKTIFSYIYNVDG